MLTFKFCRATLVFVDKTYLKRSKEDLYDLCLEGLKLIRKQEF